MNHLFLPFRQAVILKKQGFNSPCFAYYDDKGELFYSNPATFDFKFVNSTTLFTLAPIYQQVIEWIEEEYGLIISAERSETKSRGYICKVKKYKSYEGLSPVCKYEGGRYGGHFTYHQALELAIDKAINLIQKDGEKYKG